MANQGPRNVGDRLLAARGVDPDDHTAGTDNGDGIDRMPTGSGEGYMSAIGITYFGERNGGTTHQSIVTLEDSDDDGVADAYATFGTVTATYVDVEDAVRSLSFDLSGAKRFVRIVSVLTTDGTDVPMCACLVLGGAARKPAG